MKLYNIQNTYPFVAWHFIIQKRAELLRIIIAIKNVMNLINLKHENLIDNIDLLWTALLKVLRYLSSSMTFIQLIKTLLVRYHFLNRNESSFETFSYRSEDMIDIKNCSQQEKTHSNKLNAYGANNETMQLIALNILNLIAEFFEQIDN